MDDEEVGVGVRVAPTTLMLKKSNAAKLPTHRSSVNSEALLLDEIAEG